MKPASESIADIIPLGEYSSWTDEQWAEHDARMAAARARIAPVAEVQRHQLDLEEHGWPRRALVAARAADVRRPAVSRLLSVDFGETCIVVLSGSRGCGKTVAAARWALDRGRPVRFVRASTFARSSRYDGEARVSEYDARALVLDDLGAEYLDEKGSFLVDLDELIDTFYGGMRPLIITTNCTKEQFDQRYGERVADRLRECARWLSVQADSMRSRRSGANTKEP